MENKSNLINKIINMEGMNNMIEVYVTLIIKGKKTLDQVPKIIRPQVEVMLKDLGAI